MPAPTVAPAANTAHEPRSKRALRPSLAVIAVAALWLSGCAIRPTPFTDAERAQSAHADRIAMFANQPPLTGPVTL